MSDKDNELPEIPDDYKPGDIVPNFKGTTSENFRKKRKELRDKRAINDKKVLFEDDKISPLKGKEKDDAEPKTEVSEGPKIIQLERIDSGNLFIKNKNPNYKKEIKIDTNPNLNETTDSDSYVETKPKKLSFGTLSKLISPSYTDRELRKLKKKKTVVQEVAETWDCGEEELIHESPNKSNPEHNIILKKFYDYRPGNKSYFSKPYQGDITPAKDGIAVIIPFFNEASHELQQTLNSLYNSFVELKRLSNKWRDKKLYVCLIQDGWHKADKSMKDYLKDLFPKTINDVGWWDHFDEFKSDFNNPNSNAMFIFERRDYLPTAVNVQQSLKDDPKFMKLTLLVKINNRRKHNSHEWFLAKTGFAETVNAKYLFLTDAFTIFSHTCLYYLVKELDKNHNLSAVTGRQRLMTREQQGSYESIFSFGYILRNIQLFDFELANAVYNGAFHLGGLLPVIPGPCGLYRGEDLLQDNVRDSYFKVVNEEPDKTGLILGNLRIAEDRVLSYYSVIKTKEQKSMAFNPLAVFYFEAETDLQKFILQRRRWINGSIAGYIYLLFIAFSDFKDWDAGAIRKTYVWFLLFCQFLIYCMVSIAPGISIKILYYGLNYFLEYYGINWDLELMAVFLILWAIYVAHVSIHYRSKFNYPIMGILVILSVLTSIVSFASLFHYAFIYSGRSIIDIFASGNPILYLGLAVFFGPFLLALLLSGKGHSLMYMIKSFIQYLLFLPMMISWFGSYAYSRTWDLTWGNRPASELAEITEEQKKIMVNKFKEKAVRIIIVLVILNLIVFFIPLAGQLVLMGAFFAIALFQMLFSFIYCIIKIGYKLKIVFGKCSKRSERGVEIQA